MFTVIVSIKFCFYGHIGAGSRIDWSKLRVVDSLIIASRLEMNVDLFVSNDKHFIKAVPDDDILCFDVSRTKKLLKYYKVLPIE